ncbi:MAG: hypothetical protein KatS3mg055_1021 [Chloroflexus sp.]|jgi:hypothetical protein|nr:MAG: hypothetical protein KatS3mg055_1021 [Chloroflexus sp.]
MTPRWFAIYAVLANHTQKGGVYAPLVYSRA